MNVLPRRLRAHHLQRGFLLNPFRFSQEEGDPNFASVVSLLHMDGVDQSTSFPDVTGKMWSAVGNARIRNAQSKFNGSSAYFDGSGDRVSSVDGAGFDLAGDFTIEGWLYPISSAAQLLIGANSGAGNGNSGWDFGRSAGGVLRFFNAFTFTGYNATTTVPLNSWSHIAATRSGSTLRLFLNGVQDLSDSLTTSFSLPVRIHIGANGHSSPTNTSECYIDDVRITKGVARYTANFTPPAAPFPDS